MSVSDTSKIVSSFGHETNDVIFEFFHFELLEIRIKCYFGEAHSVVFRNYCVFLLTHVFCENLPITLVLLRVSCLNYEFFAEDIGELGSVAISSSGNFLLIIVVIG